MSFSTFNSFHLMHTSGINIKPPTNVYVSAVTSTSITYSLLPPSLGITPQNYEANITMDGINYTIQSNITSPCIITGLTTDTSYNGFIYSIYNGKYSTNVEIKGYTMPINCNTTASIITGVSPSLFNINK